MTREGVPAHCAVTCDGVNTLCVVFTSRRFRYSVFYSMHRSSVAVLAAHIGPWLMVTMSANLRFEYMPGYIFPFAMPYLPYTFWFETTYCSCCLFYEYAWGGVVCPDGIFQLKCLIFNYRCSLSLFNLVVRFGCSFRSFFVVHFGCILWLIVLVARFGCLVLLFILVVHFGRPFV